MLSYLTKIKELVNGRVKVDIPAFALGPVTSTTVITCLVGQVCGTRTFSLWIFRNQEEILILKTLCEIWPFIEALNWIGKKNQLS